MKHKCGFYIQILIPWIFKVNSDNVLIDAKTDRKPVKEIREKKLTFFGYAKVKMTTGKYLTAGKRQSCNMEWLKFKL